MRWLVLFLSILGALGCEPKPTVEPTASAASSPVSSPPPAPKPSAAPVPSGPPLLTPAAAVEEAPATFKVELDTTKGKIVIAVTREWSPRGADRFFNLVKIGYYDDVAFHRVINGFVAQFGANGDPKVTQVWSKATIMDEMVKTPNKKGTVTFAKRTSDTRTTQIFINMKDNTDLDADGFSPFGEVVEGLDVLGKLHHEYGERTQEPEALKGLLSDGNAFLKKEFPKLDYIKKAKIL